MIILENFDSIFEYTIYLNIEKIIKYNIPDSYKSNFIKYLKQEV
jgi:hypothetical protein